MGKNNMGFFYGKLYNSCNRTFSVGNGEKFIGGTGRGQYFCTEKKYIPPFVSKLFFILKGWQCPLDNIQDFRSKLGMKL
jgi:hypothetical protein